MSYENVLAFQSKPVFAFAKVSRKKLVLGNQLTLEVSDGVYSFPWTLGPVVQITIGDYSSSIASRQTGVMTPASDRASMDNYNEFYLDESEGKIYLSPAAVDIDGNSMYLGASGNATSGTFYLEYVSYFATEELPFYEDPESDLSDMIKWEDGLLEIPTVNRSVADNYSGYAPSEISPLQIAHNGSDLWESVENDSFLYCSAEVWTCVGPLRSENCRKVFTGKISNMTFDDRKISFELVENSGLLEGVYEGRYYSSASAGFTAVDPVREGETIPLAFGSPAWIKTVNIDYIKDGAATTNNRIWAAYEAKGFNTGTVNFTLGTVSGAGPYLVTGMNEADVRTLNVGDWVQRISDGAWATVTNVNSATSITLQGILGTVPASSQAFTRPAIQEVFFQIPSKQGTVVNWRIYESSTMSQTVQGDVVCLQLSSGFEAAASGLGISTIDPDDFEIYVRVAGVNHALTYEGFYINALGAATETMNLFWYLKHVIGLSDSEIDGQSFIDCQTARPLLGGSPELGQNVAYFVHPMWTQDFETHKIVVSRLLQQIGAVGYFNRYGEFTVKARGVLGAADFEIKDDDMVGQPSFEIRHDDIRSFVLDGSCPAVGVRVTTTKVKPATTTITIRQASGPIGENVSNKYARARGILNSETVQLYDIGKDVAAGGYYLYRLALQRIANYFGDRRLTVSFRAGGEILDAEPGDIVTLNRALLPGYAYVKGETDSQKFFILSIQKIGSFAIVTVEDQHSIEQLGSF